MANCETLNELLDLQKQLMSIQDMIGWLCTSHRYVVNYENNPDATKKIQKQLDEASEFINISYINSILDEAGFRPSNKWINPNDKKEFKAWVHIRHTGAHRPNGRANVYYQDFDDFMNSNYQGLSGLKQNCTFDPNTINLKYTISYKFFEFAQNMVKRAIGFCANSNIPI